jgi:hypothetical protein
MRKFIFLAAIASFLPAFGLWAAPSESETRKAIVDTAQSFQGVPYVYGAESPEAFDCSGLVQYVYEKAASLHIPRNSKGIWAAGTELSLKDAKPGDIAVFDTIHAGGPSHVAILKGDGTIIHAVSEPTRALDGKKTGVIVSALKDSTFERTMLGMRGFVVSVFPGEEAKKTQTDAAAADKAAANAAKVRVPEAPLAQIGLEITRTRDVEEYPLDPIPAATGTAIAFTITNMTGKDGRFTIAFYRAYPFTVLYEEKVELRAGASKELSAYTYSEPGIYRLNVKTPDNTQVLQRAWKVIELKSKKR